MLYLRDWSARAQSSFRAKTLHGDFVLLAQVIERAADRKKSKIGFGNATSRGIEFIEEILIRARVMRESKKGSNCATISKAIRRYREKLKKLQTSQSN